MRPRIRRFNRRPYHRVALLQPSKLNHSRRLQLARSIHASRQAGHPTRVVKWANNEVGVYVLPRRYNHLRDDVVALYIDEEHGPYPDLIRDCYGAVRDARTYEGELPVIAHPPCGPWGRMANWCTKQDPLLAISAVEQVRRVGGVLEHPIDSKLWAECDIPRPTPPSSPHRIDADLGPGFTERVEQWRWGHSCVKPTWLYIVGYEPDELPPQPERDESEKPDYRLVNIRTVSKKARRLTPPDFATWLTEIASQCRVEGE